MNKNEVANSEVVNRGGEFQTLTKSLCRYVAMSLFTTNCWLLATACSSHAQTVELKKVLTIDSYAAHDRFNNPLGLYYDKKRNRLFVADTNNHRVVVFTREGLPITQLGVRKELEFPEKVAVSSKGKIYVLEQTTHLVKTYDANFEFRGILDVASIANAQKKEEQNPQKDETVTLIPKSITLDSKDNLFVLSKKEEIYVFQKDDSFLFSFGGKGQEHSSFVRAADFAVSENGTMYVLDAGRTQDMIRIFDRSGTLTRAFGKKDQGVQDLANPVSLALDRDEKVWIVDEGCQCIKVFEKSSLYLFSAGSFFYPKSVTFDPFGRIYVLESGEGKVSVFELSGTFALSSQEKTAEW